jgi:L,D-transpeptidase catalytic domain
MLTRGILKTPALVLALAAVLSAGGAGSAQQQQNFIRYDRFESERSDKLTGGHIERAEFEPGQPDIKLTLNVPSFRLTLWQNGKEVKSYMVGVGMKDYPIYIGEREAREIIWNPPWIPPASDWVGTHKGVRPGEVIPAGDPRNPLGKLKIPLGDAYLIHQATGPSNLGNLVSHGCVRMLRSDLYDLAEKIVAARALPVTRKRIEAAKRSTRTLAVALDAPLRFDINYDTLVVEGRTLYIYPDVYDRHTNTVARLRDELRTSGVNDSAVDDETLQKMLDAVTRRTKFVVPAASIEQGRALADGHTEPLIGQPRPSRPAARRRAPSAGR